MDLLLGVSVVVEQRGDRDEFLDAATRRRDPHAYFTEG